MKSFSVVMLVAVVSACVMKPAREVDRPVVDEKRSPPTYDLRADSTSTSLNLTLASVVTCERGGKRVECERAPAVAVALGIVFATADGKQSYITIGTTDREGKLSAQWAVVVAQLPPDAKVDGSIAAGSPESIAATLASGGKPTTLANVTVPLNVDPELAWSTTAKANTVAAYRAYRDRFPQSPHAGAADQRARAILAADALKTFEAAIGAEQIEPAEKALEGLRTSGEPPVVADAEGRLDKLRGTLRVRSAREQLPKLLATIETSSDPAVAISQLKTTIEILRPVDADAAAQADTQLAKARDAAVARLVREGQASASLRDFDTAKKRFDAATTIAVDVKAIVKTRAAAYDTALKAGQKEARNLAAKKQYAEAIAIIDVLLVIAPQNPSLAADKTRWAAAAERIARTQPSNPTPVATEPTPAPVPPVAAGPSLVQFALPENRTELVMSKLPVQPGCQTSVASFLARPSCKTADCPPRTVARATFTCGAQKLTFLQDRTNVWLTCESGSCADCVVAGKTALATLVGRSESLFVVQGCKK